MGSDAPTASTLIELYRRGLIALQEQLGPVDSIRFLQPVRRGGLGGLRGELSPHGIYHRKARLV